MLDERVAGSLVFRSARFEQILPGVDLSKLTAAKRVAAIKALNADDCKCGCGLTLAECRINDPDCKISLPLAQAVVQKIAGEN